MNLPFLETINFWSLFSKGWGLEIVYVIYAGMLSPSSSLALVHGTRTVVSSRGQHSTPPFPSALCFLSHGVPLAMWHYYRCLRIHSCILIILTSFTSLHWLYCPLRKEAALPRPRAAQVLAYKYKCVESNLDSLTT